MTRMLGTQPTPSAFVLQIIARVSVDNRTRALLNGLQRVTDISLLTSRVEELSCHLLEFPETRGVVIKVCVCLHIGCVRQRLCLSETKVSESHVCEDDNDS